MHTKATQTPAGKGGGFGGCWCGFSLHNEDRRSVQVLGWKLVPSGALDLR